MKNFAGGGGRRNQTSSKLVSFGLLYLFWFTLFVLVCFIPF